MQPLPKFCRWPFAPLIVAMATVVGEMCFLGLNALYDEPLPDIDYWFYAYLFAAIGAVTGIVGWYTARIVALKHGSLSKMGLLLLIPYLFVALLAIDKNPSIVAVATVAFGFIMGMAWAGQRAAGQSARPITETTSNAE